MANKLVWGMQLPVQTLTKSIREEWEETAGVADIAAVAQTVDEAGGDFVGVCDHVAIPDIDYTKNMDTQWYDPISTLGYLAASTKRVRLLSTVYIAAYRHPLLSAKQFMTLDHLSGGRLICGVGAGHVQAEFEMFGVDFASRGRVLDEVIDAMRHAFVNPKTEHHGAHFEYDNMVLRPRPTQEMIPIWIGGGGKPALRRVAERGDGWIPQGNPPETMQAAVDYIRSHRDTVRPGKELDLGLWPGNIYVGKPFDGAGTVIGDGEPERIAEKLRFAHTLGCSVLHLHFRSRTRAELCDQIAGFGRDVWPLVG